MSDVNSAIEAYNVELTKKYALLNAAKKGFTQMKKKDKDLVIKYREQESKDTEVSFRKRT